MIILYQEICKVIHTFQSQIELKDSGRITAVTADSNIAALICSILNNSAREERLNFSFLSCKNEISIQDSNLSSESLKTVQAAAQIFIQGLHENWMQTQDHEKFSKCKDVWIKELLYFQKSFPKKIRDIRHILNCFFNKHQINSIGIGWTDETEDEIKVTICASKEDYNKFMETLRKESIPFPPIKTLKKMSSEFLKKKIQHTII